MVRKDKHMIKQHPLMHTLTHLKGNHKACVYTEPLWGIPFNLFASYVSIYICIRWV